jgi:putative FmdB family regulatory protein
MPTYEYLCVEGHTFEVQQSITDEPLTVCIVEDCGAEGVAECGEPCQRQLCPTAFHLTGSGWAKDGYSSSGGKKKDK